MPLSVNHEEWKSCLSEIGVFPSADFNAVTQALQNYENSAGTLDGVRLVRAAFEKWRTGKHPGEHVVAKKTKEYGLLEGDLLRLLGPVAPLAPVALGPAKPSGFVLSLWTCPHSLTWPKSIDARLKELDTALAKVRTQIGALAGQYAFDQAFQGIFLAPEYYFTEQNANRVPLAEMDYRTLERQLYSLSEKYPDILLVPGTIHYRKDLMRPKDAAAAFKVDPKTGKRTVPKTSEGDRRVRFGFELLKAAKNTNELLGNELILKGDDRPADSHLVPSHLDLAVALRDKSKNPVIVRNAAFMFLNGRRVAKYDKQVDFVEANSNAPDDFMFIPGTKNQCPEVFGQKFGVEICYDHANGVLKKRAPADLRFHLVVSDWAKTSTGNMAMANGCYFLHASTNYQEVRVFWRSETGMLFDLTVFKKYHVSSEDIGGCYLDMYGLPMPPASGVVSLPAPPPRPVNPIVVKLPVVSKFPSKPPSPPPPKI